LTERPDTEPWRSEAPPGAAGSQPPPPTGPALEGPAAPPLGAPLGGPAAWSPGDALLGVLYVFAAVFVGGGIVFALAGGSGLDATIGAQVVLELAFLGSAFLIASRKAGRDRAGWALGLRRPSAPWAGATALAFFGYLAFAVVFTQLVAEPEQTDVADELGFSVSTFGAIAAGLLIVGVAPVAEEIFFRGFFYGGMRSRLPFALAAGISGAFFGLIHFTTGNWAAVAQLAVLGIILCWLYERTGSLIPPIAMHLVNNALAFSVLVST
jgi:membrane protease YdiL (CAAX protease family)